ncbi:MAG: pyridoxal 5'-phosphate synthase, partial [Halothiobacillaceae bacterium]
AANPYASVAFYWPENDRQVRVEGRVERLPEADSEAYFNQRPLGSRLAAAASYQSQPIESREVLEARVEELKRQYPAGDVPRNPEWGGFRLVPEVYEFWQGRESRLHDRFTYTRTADGWAIQRLMP